MQPLNEHELMLVRGMLAELQATEFQVLVTDRRTDQNQELVALKDENEQLRGEIVQLEDHRETRRLAQALVDYVYKGDEKEYTKLKYALIKHLEDTQ